MTMRMSLGKSVKVAGKTFTQNVNLDADVGVVVEKLVPAAKTGTLTTRTDNDTGTATMATGHGIVSTNLVDVYWTGGSRRRMVATVTGLSVVLDGGAGDNLPTAATALTAMVPLSENVVVDPDDMTGFVCGGNTVASSVCLRTSAPATIFDMTIAAGRVVDWYTANGDSNPVTGSTPAATVLLSHGDSTKSHTMKVGFVTA